MEYKYKITYLIGQMDASLCPPPFVKAIFPNFAGERVELDQSSCCVYFKEKQEPVKLSELILIEETVVE